MKKAILVVSFGTSVIETREVTLDSIVHDICDSYPDYQVTIAWTSSIIREKLKERDGVIIPGVSEALQQLVDDGVEQVVIQPTHMIGGKEFDKIANEAEGFRAQFKEMIFSKPLLNGNRDCRRMAVWAKESFELAEDEALVLMGHGSSHSANSIYSLMNMMFQEEECERVILGTVEGTPTFDAVLHVLEDLEVSKVVLSPFLVVAGDHALNDLAGDEPDSWKQILLARGYEVRQVLKGLGEYPNVRAMYLKHLEDAIQAL